MSIELTQIALDPIELTPIALEPIGGDLRAAPTHYSSHWWVTETEYSNLVALRNTALSAAGFRAQRDLSRVRDLFETTNRDYVRPGGTRLDGISR